MMHMRRSFISILQLVIMGCVCLCVTFAAQASNNRLSVKVTEKDGYDRAVFYVFGYNTYEMVSVAEGVAHLTFSTAGTADLGGYRAGTPRYIKGMDVASSLSDGLVIEIQIYPSSRIRHFQVGGRIFVDVFEPEDPTERIEVQKAQDGALSGNEEEGAAQPNTNNELEENSEPAAPSMPQDTKPEVTPKVENAPNTETVPIDNAMAEAEALNVEAGEEQPVIDDPMEPVAETNDQKAVLDLPSLPQQAYSITFTATAPFGMASYERYGRVWFILDNPDIKVLPQIEGPDDDVLGDMVRYQFPGGQAFSLSVPQDLTIRSEGGGLYWRFVMAKDMAIDTSGEVTKQRSGGEYQNGEIRIRAEKTGQLLRFPDPVIGDALAVVTTTQSQDQQLRAMRFVDVDLIAAFAGVVVRPKSDGLRIKVEDDYVLINRQDGLTMGDTIEAQVGEFMEGRQLVLPEDRIFNFASWALGTRKPFAEKSQALNKELQVLAAPDAFISNRDASVAILVRAGKFYLSQAMPQEALGYLRMARQIAPELRQSPDFVSIRGAAYALSSYLRQARRDFNHPALDDVDEVKLWKAFIASSYKRHDQAYEMLPTDLSPLMDYPIKMRSKMAFALAQTAEHVGDPEMIRTLMQMLKANEGAMSAAMRQGAQYYESVAALSKNLPAEAYALLEVIEDSEDNFYSTKASYTRVMDQMDRGLIDLDQALQQMERLRYAWRGDKLEASILEDLGRLYIDSGQEHKGLSTLRQAVSQVRDRNSRESITETMRTAFTKLFNDEGENKLTALEAVTIYEEFQELTPTGKTGDMVMANLVDRLIEVDLLDRATRMLRQLADKRLEGDEAEQAILRLTSILLMDKKPKKALATLDGMEKRFGPAIIQRPPPEPEPIVLEFEPIDPTLTPMVRRAIEKQREAEYEAYVAANPPPPAPVYIPQPQNPLHLKREVLRAKTLSDLGQYDEALATVTDLPEGQDITRLRADIAWRAGEWELAASSFDDILTTEEVGDALSITTEHQAIILNRAIALALSNNTGALSVIRDEYSAEMASSPLYQSFQVITRPQRGGLLADRETLMSLMAEVDLFNQFLDGDS